MKACDKCHAADESVETTSLLVQSSDYRASAHPDLCQDCRVGLTDAIGVEFSVTDGKNEQGGFGGSGGRVKGPLSPGASN